MTLMAVILGIVAKNGRISDTFIAALLPPLLDDGLSFTRYARFDVLTRLDAKHGKSKSFGGYSLGETGHNGGKREGKDGSFQKGLNSGLDKRDQLSSSPCPRFVLNLNRLFRHHFPKKSVRT